MSIILTFDYELFGSGNGCFKRHLIDPTESIRSILRKYDVKATFFIEYLELLQYKKIINYKDSITCENSLLLPRVEEQIRSLYLEGHDIQLHIHPQWEGALYDFTNKTFKLNFDLWRFSDLPLTNHQPLRGMTELLQEGKVYLESLIDDKSYRCHGFRAGGYNIGNLKKTVDALKHCGFLFDSSVYPGGFCDSNLSSYDYTSVDKTSPYWLVGDTILESSFKSESSLIEFPIFSHSRKSLDFYSLPRLFAFLKNRNFKTIPVKSKKTRNAVILKKTNFLNNKKSSSNWDLCLSGKSESRRFLNDTAYTNSSDPITLIGHPKDYSFFSNIDWFLRNTIHKFQFHTMSDAANKINHSR